jgi:hypothetical protein
VFALVSGVALHALGRWALPVALVLVPLQGALGYREIWVWEHAYRGVEWMEPLAEEAGDDGLVLVLEPWEGDAVKKHSRMDALSLRIARIRGMEEVDPDAPGVTESSLRAVDAALTRGGIFAVTRSLVEHARERESVQRLLDRFAERYGEPVSTRREEYLVYPAREVPPR